MREQEKKLENKITVSIICTAYNQEDYIADTIESFLMQITDFKYEIIVHDDASTDRTADIIKEYEKKFPNIIRTICQKENQYSKNANIFEDFMFPIARGEYLAICEGDDYWTDPYKLQKQIDALNKHLECDVCSHTASMVRADNKKEIGKIIPSTKNTIFNVNQVIRGDGAFVATNSLVFRKSIFESKIPAFRRTYRIDYSLQIMGALRGGMIYLTDCMSAYRVYAKSSWSSRMRNDQEACIRHYNKMINMLRVLDEETCGKYAEAIANRIKWQEFQILSAKNQYREMLTKDYRDIFVQLTNAERLKIYIKALAPWIVKLNEWRKKHDKQR